MAQPFPLPRETRETAILTGDGVSATYGPFAFKIFDIEDVKVFTRADDETAWTETAVTIEKSADLPLDTFSITFAAPIAATTDYYVEGRRLHEREAGITRGSQISSDGLEKELSKQGAILQELRRDHGRSITVSKGEAALTLDADIPDGSSLIKQGSSIVGGDNPEAAVAAAAASAAAALASQQAAAVSEFNAQGSATEAQVYAQLLNAAVYDFNFDSDPETPGYDWNI